MMDKMWRWEEGEIKMTPSPLVHGMRQTEELYTEKRRQGEEQNISRLAGFHEDRMKGCVKNT